MHPVARVAVTFALVQVVATAAAWACSCLPVTATPAELRDSHERVFVGEVVSGPHVSGCGAGRRVSSDDALRYTLEVREAFKGVAVGDKVELATARDSAACGVPFEPGQEWLIYTNDADVGLCDPIGLAEQKTAELEALRGKE